MLLGDNLKEYMPRVRTKRLYYIAVIDKIVEALVAAGVNDISLKNLCISVVYIVFVIIEIRQNHLKNRTNN